MYPQVDIFGIEARRARCTACKEKYRYETVSEQVERPNGAKNSARRAKRPAAAIVEALNDKAGRVRGFTRIQLNRCGSCVISKFP